MQLSSNFFLFILLISAFGIVSNTKFITQYVTKNSFFSNISSSDETLPQIYSHHKIEDNYIHAPLLIEKTKLNTTPSSEKTSLILPLLRRS